MRRTDREITEFRRMLQIMEECDVCHLALHGEEYPYVLSLNFGMEETGGQVTLYFHSAKEGYKLDLIAADPRVSFEMDRAHRLVTDPVRGFCTMEYESVMGCGRIEVVSEEEKEHGLHLLMAHYHKEDFPYSPESVPHTAVLKLTVEQMTAKERKTGK